MAHDADSKAEVEAHLERVITSAAFRGADRSVRVLRYIVSQALLGHGDQLKDYTLGAEALGRGVDFDPRTDPIARVEASRLRSRLDVYYATEGASEAIRILVPKGGYVPRFERRSADTTPPSPAPALSESSAAAAQPVRRRGLSAWRAFSLAAASAVVAAWAIWWLAGARSGPGDQSPLRVDLATPPTIDPASLALAPDGQSLVFAASQGGVHRLWLRRLGDIEARALAGTDYGAFPFWAPDGRAIGFFADGRVKALDLQTRLVRILSTAPVPPGAAWSRDDVILHPLVPDSPLFRSTSNGATLEPVTRLAAGHTGHRGPVFLPDGRRFLFYAAGSPESRGIYLGALGSDVITRVVDADAPPVFLPPATLLYVQHTTLLARQFDPSTATLAGEPIAVADSIGVEPSSGLAAIAASASGTIAYRTRPVGAQRQLVWVDRGGKRRRAVGEPEERGPSYGAISPDGRRLAVQRTVAGNTDIWLVDLDRGASVRFTSEPRADIAPAWSPLGDRLIYASQVNGVFELFEKGRDELVPRLLLRDGQAKQVTDWSRDGRYLLYRTISTTPRPDTDIWAMPLDGDRTPFVVLQTPFEERDAQFSPDGRFVAYQSNESGRHEIYAQPFRGGERQRISSDGGVQVRWRADGRELFYLRPDGQLMAASVSMSGASTSLRLADPAPLFGTTLGATQGVALHGYIVAPDGQAFLMDMLVEQQPPPIRLVLNWGAPGR
jgi:Tol biopolymer transport system component